jgi:hypothetical protein
MHWWLSQRIDESLQECTKQRGLIKSTEGKLPLPFAGYRLIVQKFYTMHPNLRDMSWSQGIFGWMYTVWSWNLMARSVTTADLHFSHLSWDRDCLKVSVPSTKSNKDGARSAEYHVYVNPEDPQICQILSFAVYFFN